MQIAVLLTSALLSLHHSLPAQSVSRAPSRRPSLSNVRCAVDSDNAGRGFGKAAPAPKQKQRPSAAPASGTAVAVDRKAAARSEAEERGRKALEALRAEAGAQPADPFKKSGPALTPEEAAPLDPSEGVMPEVVSQRMLNRVVPFAALPVFGGALVFVGFYFANTQLELDVPPMIVAYATQALLLLSFAGITYGVMSTSWDEEIEGTLLGTENLKRNFDLMRGSESARQAEAQQAADRQDAEEQGIMMGPASVARRDKKRQQGQSD